MLTFTLIGVKPGGKRWRVALLLAAGMVLAIILCEFSGSREPRYQGKTLSHWFKEYCYRSTILPYHHDDEQEATEALKALGTNALPFLLREAFNTNADSALRVSIHGLFKTLPDSWHLPRFVIREVFRRRAADAIQEINHPPPPFCPCC